MQLTLHVTRLTHHRAWRLVIASRVQRKAVVLRPCVVGIRALWSYDYGMRNRKYPHPSLLPNVLRASSRIRPVRTVENGDSQLMMARLNRTVLLRSLGQLSFDEGDGGVVAWGWQDSSSTAGTGQVNTLAMVLSERHTSE